jgi:hypothetical protein
MGKALRVLNLQKDISDYDWLLTIMIVAIAAVPYSPLSTPQKVVIARTYLF